MAEAAGRKADSRSIPPWDTFLRVGDYADKRSAKTAPGDAFLRRYIIWSFLGALRVLLYLVVLFAIGVALGELFGSEADRFGDTLPLIIALSLAAELVTKVFERLLGKPSGEDFRVRVNHLRRDAGVVRWCQGKSKGSWKR